MIKILSNKRYKSLLKLLGDYGNEIIDLKNDYDNLKKSNDMLIESIVVKDNRIKNLEENNKNINKMYIDKIKELKAEIKSLKSAKGGYARQVSKIKAELEETQKKLEESMTNKYLVKKIPMGKLPKGQVMKMKSHTKQDKIIQKIYEKMEKDEI